MSIKLIENITNPSLNMKMVYRNSPTVANTNQTISTANSTYMIHFCLAPSIFQYDGIHEMRLRFKQSGTTQAAAKIVLSTDAYINQSWEKPLDYVVEGSEVYREVDLAEFFGGSTEEKYFSIICNQELKLYTSLAATEYKPQLRICKIESNDLIKNQIYLEGSIKEDNYKVNIRTGKMYYDKELITAKTSNSEIVLGISYNIENNNELTLNSSVNTGLGKGFKFNYQQIVYQNGNDYIYIDDTYKKHIFKLANNLSNSSSTKVYYDQSGSYAVMNVSSSGYVIKQENKTLNFNNTGLLTSITLRKTSSLIVTQTLTYDSSNRLIQISADEKSINISYTSTLVTITEGGRTVKINIDSNNLITSIVDEMNKTEYFQYVTQGASTLQNRAARPPIWSNFYVLNSIKYGNYEVVFKYSSTNKVEKVSNYYSDNIRKKEEISYNGNKTKITTTKYVTSSGVDFVFEYQFDENGYLKSSYEIIGSSVCSLKHYNFEDAKQEVIDFSSGAEYYISDFVSSASTNTNIYFENIPKGEYILNIGCKISGSESNNLNIGQLKGVVTVNQTVKDNLIFNSTAEGYQFLTTNIKITEQVEDFSIYVPITNTISNRTVTFTSIILTPKPADKVELCTNISGNNFISTISNVSYYANNIVAITYYDGTTKTATDLKMSLDDIIQTEKSYYRDTYKLVWYNNGENMLYNCSNVSLSIGANSSSLSNIKYGLIKTQEFKDKAKRIVYSYQLDKVNSTSIATYVESIQLLKENNTLFSNLTGTRTIYDQYNNFLSKIDLYPLGNNAYKEEVMLNSVTGRIDESINSKGANSIISTKYSYDSLGFISTLDDGHLITSLWRNPLGKVLSVFKNNIYVQSNNYLADLKTLSGVGSWNETYNIEYDNNDCVQKVKTSNTQYSYVKNAYGELEKVQMLNSNGNVIETIATFSYSVSGGYVVVSIANSVGEVKTFTYDKYGKLLKIKDQNIEVLSCEYAERDNLNSSTARLRSKYVNGQRVGYDYDKFGNVCYESNNQFSLDITKDNTQYDTTDVNNMGYDYIEIVDSGVCSTQKVTTTSKKEDYGTVFSKSLEYDSLMYGIMNMSDHVSYDDFGRFNGQTVNMNNYQYYKTVDYLVDTSSSTSGNVTKYISSEEIKKNNVVIFKNDYEYERGLVCKKTDINGQIEEYSYDYAGRVLTYSKNNVQIKSYSYDEDGNVIIAGTNPVYSNQKLMSFNGKSLTYFFGFLSSYGNINFSFTNGRLVSYNGNGKNISFTYDGESRRKSKTVNGSTTNYTYIDNKLNTEIRPSYYIQYLYGVNDMVGFIYGGNMYTYVRNIFNDVEAIVDHNGNIVGRYSYDPFGNTTITLDTNGIATINPIRFRGYYYDVETGLFMVGHRYYNPEWGRWIQPDDIEYLDPTNINGETFQT